MKKTIGIVLMFCLLFTTFLPSAFALQNTVSELNSLEKSKEISIIIAENATEQEQYSAGILQEYLKKVNEANYPIVTDEKPFNGFNLYIGKTAFTQSNTEGLADGSYYIKSCENGIEINGAGNRGIVYGVFRFLEEVAGYHVFTAEQGMYTKNTSLDFERKYDISYSPYFEYTETDWHSPRNVIYSLANSINGSNYRQLSSEQGGTVDYISGFCHTLSTQFCSSETYFKDHPEYFALHDGERTPDQLCLTNEEVYRIVLNEVLTLIEEKHDKDAAVQILSLTQNDNYNFCQCDGCKKIDEKNGSQSGTVITFVNRIAEQVEKAGYDNIAIDTFAYQYSRKAPTQVKPLQNVIVRLCTIECCFSHALNDETCKENVDLMYDLNEWSKICDRIYVWDYATNYAYTIGIFPDFQVIQQNMQCFYEHGVKGVYEEGNYYVDACNSEFGELRAYLLSRLMQNPYCDFTAETDNFLNAYYGQGGQYIGEFLQIIAENAQKQHANIYDKMTETFTLSQKEAMECDTLWQKAKEAAENEEILEHIKRSELSWRYVKSSLGLTDFKGIKRISANKSLYADLQSFGISCSGEGRDEIAVSILYYLSPAETWAKADTKILPFNIIAGVLYAIALIFALILMIKAYKAKKYSLCIHFPLLAAFIEIVLWNRRTFLAWVELDEFVISCILFAVVSFLLAFTVQRLKEQKTAKMIFISILKMLVFVVLYITPLTIINVIIYKGCANALAYSVSLPFMSLWAVINEITAYRSYFKKN